MFRKCDLFYAFKIMVKLEELTDQQVKTEIEKNGIKVRRSQADKPDALRKVIIESQLQILTHKYFYSSYLTGSKMRDRIPMTLNST